MIYLSKYSQGYQSFFAFVKPLIYSFLFILSFYFPCLALFLCFLAGFNLYNWLNKIVIRYGKKWYFHFIASFISIGLSVAIVYFIYEKVNHESSIKSILNNVLQDTEMLFLCTLLMSLLFIDVLILLKYCYYRNKVFNFIGYCLCVCLVFEVWYLISKELHNRFSMITWFNEAFVRDSIFLDKLLFSFILIIIFAFITGKFLLKWADGENIITVSMFISGLSIVYFSVILIGVLDSNLQLNSFLRNQKILLDNNDIYVLVEKQNNKYKVSDLFNKFNCGIDGLNGFCSIESQGHMLLINESSEDIKNNNFIEKCFHSGFIESQIFQVSLAQNFCNNKYINNESNISLLYLRSSSNHMRTYCKLGSSNKFTSKNNQYLYIKFKSSFSIFRIQRDNSKFDAKDGDYILFDPSGNYINLSNYWNVTVKQ